MTWGTDGFRWPVTRQGGALLSVQGQAAAASFTSLVAESVTGVSLYLSRVTDAPAVDVEVWTEAALVAAPVTNTFRPNEDVAQSSIVTQSGAATGLWDSVDSTTRDIGKYLSCPGGVHGWYAFRVGSAGFAATAVSAVRLFLVVEATSSSGSVGVLTLSVESGSDSEVVLTSVVSPSDGAQTLSVELTQNPLTGAAWTVADIAAFDATSDLRVDVGQSSGPLRIYQAWMEVDSIAGTAARGRAIPAGDGWVSVTFDAAWAKAAGAVYYVVLRKTNTAGQCVWNALDSEAACPQAGWASWRPALRADGVVADMGEASTAAHAVVLTTATGSSSDSQPYARLNREPIYGGRTVSQDLVGSPSAGFVAQVLAGVSGEPDAPLTVTYGTATATLDPEELVEAPRSLREVGVNLSAVVTASTLSWSSAASEGSGWEVAVLDSVGAPSAGAAGFGGAGDAGTAAGTRSTDTDVPHHIAAVPATITGVTATGATEGVTLTWGTTGLTTNFARYVITRGTAVVAYLTDRTITAWTDSEARIGIAETYTVQVENSDGVTSLPSAPASAAAAGACVRLVTNHDPAVNMDDFPAVGEPSLTFQTSRRVSYAQGRDYALVARGREDWGATWSIDLAPVDFPRWDEAFDALRGIAAADVPHLTLLFTDGSRWFVEFNTSAGTYPFLNRATATGELVEVAAHPTPVTIS